MKKSETIRPELLAWYFVLCLVLSTAPFYFWRLPIYILMIGAYFLVPFWKKSFSGREIVSLFLLFVFFIISSFNRYDDTNLIGKFFLFLPFLLYLVKDNVWRYTYNSFVKIYALALIPSIIIYIVVIWLEIDLPNKTIEPLNNLKLVDYQAYPFMVTSFTKIPWDSFRFCAYFDEPGVVGTISGVLLVVNRLNFKQWYNWPILISGIFSFSLFFYVLIGLYVFFWGGKVSRLIIVSFIVVAVIYLVQQEDSVLNNLILSRLEIDDGQIVGNNRTKESFDVFYSKFLDSDKLWFGYGGGYSSKVVDVGGFSYKDLIVDYGIIVFGLYVIGMILLLWEKCKKRKYFLIALFLFVTVMYQRPMVSSMLGIFLFLSPCYCLATTETENESKA